MFDYNPIAVFESAVLPGVEYDLRKMSSRRRDKLHSEAADIFAEIDRVNKLMSVIDTELERAEGAAKIEPCTCKHPIVAGAKDPTLAEDCWHLTTGRCPLPTCDCRKPQPDTTIGDYASYEKAKEEFWRITYSKLFPAYIRWGVKEIRGLTIAGQPATVETLLADGTEDLVQELGYALQAMINMKPSDLRDFKWPTTSGALAAGPTADTTALPVSEVAGIASGNA